MSEIKLKAEARTEFGKGAARRIRRSDRVPAVLYGHGTDPQHVSLPGHDLMLALKSGANALLTIQIDGAQDQLVIPKQVQRDPIKGFLEHADLLIVRRGEKVTVDIPVVLVGDPAPETLVVTDATVLSIEAEATHIPESVEVSIEGLSVGDHVLAGSVTLPEGSTLAGDEDQLVVIGSAAPTAEEVEAELEEAEAEVGIERDESVEDLAEAKTEDSDADADGTGDGATDDKE